MTGMLTEGGEDLGEGGVFEVLGDDVEFDVAEAPDEADELEVTEVRGDPDGTGFAGLIFSGGVVELDFDMGLPIGAGEAACPKEVDESTGEGLVGAASDLGTLIGGVLITEGNAKVFEGGASAASIEPIGQGADGSRENEDEAAGQSRDEPGERPDELGLQKISNPFHVVIWHLVKSR